MYCAAITHFGEFTSPQGLFSYTCVRYASLITTNNRRKCFELIRKAITEKKDFLLTREELSVPFTRIKVGLTITSEKSSIIKEIPILNIK